MSHVSPFRFGLAVAALGLFCLSPVMAQQQGNRRPGGGGPGGFGGGFPGSEKIQLLSNEAVQKDLELADDQKADLKKVEDDRQAKTRDLFSGFRDLSESEREKKLAENRQKGEAIGKDVAKKVGDILLPHQSERLMGIFIQVRGGSAIGDPDVAKELGLTDQQKEKVTAAREEIGRKMMEAFRQGGGEGDREARTARFEAMRKESNDKYMGVLTAAQKDKFEKMKGEKFDVEAANLQRGGFGGGRPGGTPGQGEGGQPRRRPNNP